MISGFTDELARCARTHAIAEAYDLERLAYLRSTIEAIERHDLIPAEFDIRLFTGDLMRISLREEVGRFLFTFKAYEIGLSSFICQYLRNGMTALDVGAHVGYFSVLMARLVGANGKVVAFEPTPSTATYLTHNIGNFPWVTVEQVLVGDHEGTADFNDYGVGHSAFNSLTAARTSDGELAVMHRLQLPMITLDDYCERNNLQPDLIKIDVESAEALVLRGMERTLGQSPIVILEVGDFSHLVTEVPSSATLLGQMSARGYRLFEPGVEGLMPHRIQPSNYDYGNIVCITDDRLNDGSSQIIFA